MIEVLEVSNVVIIQLYDLSKPIFLNNPCSKKQEMQVMDSSKNVRNNNESRHSWDALSKTIWMQNDERAHSIVSLLITNDEYHLELIFHSVSMELLN